jgi:hypothetical protein
MMQLLNNLNWATLPGRQLDHTAGKEWLRSKPDGISAPGATQRIKGSPPARNAQALHGLDLIAIT